MMQWLKQVTFLFLTCGIGLTSIGQRYDASGTVSFVSDAPMEIIEATSGDLRGILDESTEKFAFSISIKTFDGFNSPLQKEHFNEHYLESSSFPKSTFVGNLIGLQKCGQDCDEILVAKGKLDIHGITKVFTIPIHFKRAENGLHTAEANFEVKLDDFNITIPKILEAKISPLIQVSVKVEFTPAES